MEQNFQTSFIPKKPIVEQSIVEKKPIGFLLVIAIIIFLAMVVFSAGVYLYKSNLLKQKVQMEEDLNAAKGRFEPSQIAKLKLLDKRLSASNKVLSKHITVSPIFEALQKITIKTVQYTSFSYSFSDSKVIVNLTGQAVGYRSVALQSDLFKKNKNLIDPVFSNVTLGEKGNVLFNLQFSVDPSFVDYKQVVKRQNDKVEN